MPYLWYPPTLLALPTEIRHIIYSHLLIHRSTSLPHLIDIKVFKADDRRRTVQNLFLTCRQIYNEAFDYYYTNNKFLLSVTSPHYSLKEVTAKSDALLYRLQRVRKLCLVIETSTEQRVGRMHDGTYSFHFRSDTKYPKQQDQWTCFLNLLLKSKEGRGGRNMKELTIEDWALYEAADKNLDADIPVYASLLVPLKAHIDHVEFTRGPLVKPRR